MFMRKLLILLTAFTILSFPGMGQELNAIVRVNHQAVQTTETRIFQDMETSFSQFLNNRKWTDDTYKGEERINCNLVITIDQMPSPSSFSATVQVQSSHPVYGTGYESLMLNFADRDWQFQYTESQPIDFNENTFTSNIASLLAYYAYIIIGLDYDSFSEMGGTPYFEKAQMIVTNAQQSAGDPGWDQFGSNRRRNRYWLAENFINQQMQPVRIGMYTYHRKGLDMFIANETESRANILTTVKAIEEVRKIQPQSILLIAFMDAKHNELVSIFSKGDPQIRREAYNSLVAIDPTQTDKYSVIIKN
jgi:hypothetical protein